MNDHLHPLGDLINILFIYRTLNPVISHFKHLNIGGIRRIRHTAAVRIVDTLYHTIDLTVHYRSADILLQTFDFQFLCLVFIFTLLDRIFFGQDTGGIGKLIISGGLRLFLFQLFLRGLCSIYIILTALQIDLSLGKLVFIICGVINEQLLPCFDLIAFFYIAFFYCPLVLQLHFPGLLGLHHTGIPLNQSIAASQSCQHGNRIHIHSIFTVRRNTTV